MDSYHSMLRYIDIGSSNSESQSFQQLLQPDQNKMAVILIPGPMHQTVLENALAEKIQQDLVIKELEEQADKASGEPFST